MYPYVGGTRLEYRIFKVLSTSIRQRFRPNDRRFRLSFTRSRFKTPVVITKNAFIFENTPQTGGLLYTAILVFAWPAKDDYLRIRWRVDWKAKFYRKRIQFPAFCVELHIAGAIAACRRNRERSCVCSEIFLYIFDS